MPVAGEVVELLRYRGKTNNDSIVSLSRGFRVYDTRVDQATEQPLIPVHGEVHPDNNQLFARDIIASGMGQHSLVTVKYVEAPFINYSIPPVNQYEESFVGVDTTFEDRQVDIPLFQQTKVVLSTSAGVDEKLIWQRRKDVLPLQYTTPILRMDVSFTASTQGSFNIAVAIASVINAQNDKIHTINGRDYRFKCEGVNQRGEGEYKATYRWYEDLGVPNKLPAGGGQVFGSPYIRLVGNTLYPVYSEELILPPFSAVRIDANADSPELEPIVSFFELYEREPQGYLTLPGIA